MPRVGWLAIGALVGAAVATPAGFLPSLLLGVAATAAAAASWRGGPRRVALVLSGAALVLLRAGLGGWIVTPAQTADPIVAAADHVARVVSVGSTDGGKQRAILELAPPEPADRVYATLPRYPAVSAYDEIAFADELEEPPDGAFAAYLARSGIKYTAHVRTFEARGSTDTPLADLEHVRRTAADLLARGMPQPQAGLAAGLLIGLRDLVARDVATDFRISGLSHIVAISGSHLALVAAFATALLRRLARRRRSIVVLALIWSYSILSGASPSVIRAAVMATVIVAARESGRAGQARGALAVTATAMALIDPFVVADIGFELSLAATAGLLAWTGPLGSALERRLPSRTPAFLTEALAMSLAAQLATQPIVLLQFGQLSLVAPLANLLAAPIVAPAMLSSALAMLASGVTSLGLPEILAAPILLIAAMSVGALIAIAHACAGLPLASLTLEAPLNVMAASATLLVIVALVRHRPAVRFDAAEEALAAQRERESRARPKRRRSVVWAAGTAVLALTMSSAVVSARPDGRLHMTVLDVGQGDSILLEGPSGGRILVDTGPDPDRLIAMLDKRVPLWDRRLDIVVITHPHEDHVAGLALLLDRYRIGQIGEPGMIGLGPGDAAFRRRLAELGRETTLLAAGDRLSLDGIELDVLWPPRGGVPLHPSDGGTAVNNVSIVLAMQFGERRFLLTGDIEQQIDPQLLAGVLLPAAVRPFDVLKVAHHGSGTATTDAFLERVRPSVAIVSAGWGNPYGHPSSKTVARLTATGAKVFRTDLDGSVTVTTDGHDLAAQASGGRPLPSRPQAVVPVGPGWCPIPLTAYEALAPP